MSVTQIKYHKKSAEPAHLRESVLLSNGRSAVKNEKWPVLANTLVIFN